MKHLGQTAYKNDNGHDIPASAVEVLAPYEHIADGFYNWACGACDYEHNSRSCGWPISGQVLVCQSCKKCNLLVRTDCINVTELAKQKFVVEDRDRELVRLQGIEKRNDDERDKIKREILGLVEKAISSHSAFEKLSR